MTHWHSLLCFPDDVPHWLCRCLAAFQIWFTPLNWPLFKCGWTAFHISYDTMMYCLQFTECLFIWEPYGCLWGPLSSPLSISMNHNSYSKQWQRLSVHSSSMETTCINKDDTPYYACWQEAGRRCLRFMCACCTVQYKTRLTSYSVHVTVWEELRLLFGASSIHKWVSSQFSNCTL